MTEEQIRIEIKDIISVIAPDEDLTILTNEGNLRDQIELDSMDFLDIVMELRKRHKIEIPEADYPNLASLDSSAKYLAPLLGKN